MTSNKPRTLASGGKHSTPARPTQPQRSQWLKRHMWLKEKKKAFLYEGRIGLLRRSSRKILAEIYFCPQRLRLHDAIKSCSSHYKSNFTKWPFYPLQWSSVMFVRIWKFFPRLKVDLKFFFKDNIENIQVNWSLARIFLHFELF